MKTIAEKKINKELNGIEIYFFVYPLEGTKKTLKEGGYRWNHKKGCWYIKATETAETIADIIVETSIDEYNEIANRTGETVKEIAKMKEVKKGSVKKEKKNKYGVKVGDFFSASWGYEQTNVDFFQVIALVGETSVRVREVHPEMIKEDAVCSMAADRVYNLDRSKILPPAPYSSFINDQENGDLKRLKSYQKDGSCPQFYLASFADAHYISGETYKTYESWYY